MRNVEWFKTDDMDELKVMQEQLVETVEMVKNTLASAGLKPNWLATMEMALSHDHEWVGGTLDETMADTVAELEQAVSVCGEVTAD